MDDARDDVMETAPLRSDEPAAPLRSLSVKMFGATRELGLLPTSVHSDTHTTLLRLTRECNQRGKAIHGAS